MHQCLMDCANLEAASWTECGAGEKVGRHADVAVLGAEFAWRPQSGPCFVLCQRYSISQE